MLNNNIKILLVSFVHHIELQNFLNATHMYVSLTIAHVLFVNLNCKILYSNFSALMPLIV